MHPSDVPVVILAGGEGRRLAPLTNTRPKPMVPVANRPILEHVLEAVIDAGIEEVVFVVGYRQERIRTHFGDGDDWGVDITYVNQPTQLGTGHAILQAESAVDGPFMVMNGDRIVEGSIVEAVLEAAGEHPTVATTQVKHPSTFGVVDLDGDRITHIEEKPLEPAPTATINAGAYWFEPSIFDEIRDTDTVDGELTITATLDRLVDDGTVRAVNYADRWLDVTYLWDLPVVNASLVEDRPVAVDPTATVEAATVADDVSIAENVRVGPNATVNGGSAIGAHARIGPNAVVENAVILPDATVEAGAVIRDAIVGANATVGANVTVAGEDATVIVDGQLFEGVDLGGVIGDNAFVGGGAVLDPGAVIGNDATVQAGAFLHGRVREGETVNRG